MNEWFTAVILGILEGITEFLPISSTGHLLIASRYLELPESLSGVFEIFIQSGAIVAVLIFYFDDIRYQTLNVRTDHNTRQLWIGILIAFLPAGVLGFTLTVTGFLDRIFANPYIVPSALIAGGVLFLIAERFIEVQPTSSIATSPPTYRQALLIGLWQTAALIPGMSRSGMSIIGGLLSGLDRPRATQFSFYLALPTLGGATVFSLLRSVESLRLTDYFVLLLGMLISGIVAWVSIQWFLRYIERNNFIGFAYYRIIVGIITLIILSMT